MDIKDKISKLLALAESPNEAEAREALIKARELMAQHKLLPEEIADHRTPTVVRTTIGSSFTKRKGMWRRHLVGAIAANYCCVSYFSRTSYSKTYSIGLIGLEDDFAVCTRVYRYAERHIETIEKQIRKEHPASAAEAYINGYALGFIKGFKDACERQNKIAENNTEYGLVLVVPPEVQAEAQRGMRGTFTAKPLTYTEKYVQQGYEAGENFRPDTSLENEKLPAPKKARAHDR